MSSGSDTQANGSNGQELTRRQFLAAAAIAAAGLTGGVAGTRWYSQRKQPRARVSVYKATSYREDLARTIHDGLLNYPDVIRRARAGTVVLKPNLVEYHNRRSVNTNPAVVAAAIAAFRSIGAPQIVVAEGPGHCRDTELLLEASDMEHAIRTESVDFVDLNLDAAHSVRLSANHTKLGDMSFPDTILGSSLVVSMPKLKTHHWVGVTLSLKNMFGTVPGAHYGWPKNVLHWHGIDNSIVDINLAVKPGFAIVDGIEGMEGDGPIRGDTVASGVLVMGDSLTAVDSTAARIMGLHPEKVSYLRMMLSHGGTVAESRIDQLGERIRDVRRDFRVLDNFAFLKTPPNMLDFIRSA